MVFEVNKYYGPPPTPSNGKPIFSFKKINPYFKIDINKKIDISFKGERLFVWVKMFLNTN